MPTPEPSVSEDWLKTLYVEAWKQYQHEDQLVHTRSSFFMAVQGALMAVFAGISAPLLKLGSVVIPQIGLWRLSIGPRSINFGFLVLGLCALAFGMCAFFINRNWRASTKASRQYCNLRWSTTLRIERLKRLGRLGIAELEHAWRAFKPNKPTPTFVPFPADQELADLTFPSDVHLGPLSRPRVFDTLLRIITIGEIASVSLAVSGVLLCVLAWHDVAINSHS